MALQDTDALDLGRLSAPAAVDRLLRVALGVGLVGVVGMIAGLFISPDQFFRSYLVGFIYVAGVPLGCLALLMLHHVTGGGWGLMVRRVWEAASRTIVMVALFFVPLLFGLERVYSWARPEAADDALIAQKAPYLNSGAFMLRGAIFFVLWFALSWVLNRLSRQQDETGDPGLSRKMQIAGAPGLLLWVLLATFAGVDWLMSLDPHWYSSLYGVYFLGSMALSAMAFTVTVAAMLAGSEPLAGLFQRRHFHDYGNLLLAFVMLWGYFTLSQFLIMWSGNLPEEVPWYIERSQGGWRLLTQALMVLHFGVPFLLLITHFIKGKPRRLAAVAVLLLVMRFVDTFWQAAPAMHQSAFHWLDLVTPLGLGGLWLAFFAWQLKRRPLLPANDPNMKEAVSHG